MFKINPPLRVQWDFFEFDNFIEWNFCKLILVFFRIRLNKCFGTFMKCFNSSTRHQTSHCEFLEYWNTQKSVWRIWKHFSCLLDEGIPKIWKKLNSHGGFLRADQDSAKMCCQMDWIGCAILQGAQKAIVRIQFHIK